MAVRNRTQADYRRKGHSHLRAVDGRRQKRRRVDAKLSRSQVRSAYRLYEAGMTTSDLAKAGFERWGYSTWKRAAIALSLAFRRDGYQVRDASTAQKLRWGKVERSVEPKTACATCECLLDERTVGCDTCKARHWYRRRTTCAPRPAEAEPGGLEEAA